ncbi:hypothetical protein [Streptomyces sp. NPDC055749]
MSALRQKVNRLSLAVVGGVSVLAGGWVALTGQARRGTLSWTPPVRPGELIERYEPGTAAVAAPLAVLMAGALWWGVAQLRSTGPSALSLGSPGLRVRRRGLARAIAADLGALPGVETARVSLRGPTKDFRVRVGLRLASGAQPAEVLRLAAQGPLSRARTVPNAPHLRADIRVTARSRRPRRTR